MCYKISVNSSFGTKRYYYKEKKICIVGFCAVGVGAYLECNRLGNSNVHFLSRRYDIVEKMGAKFSFCNIDDLNSRFDIYIDCTGESELIYKILKKMQSNTQLVLLGTPRSNPKINLLKVHRENFTIHGGHELTGVTNAVRQYYVKILEKWHSERKRYSDSMVKIHSVKRINMKYIYDHRYWEPYHVIKY